MKRTRTMVYVFSFVFLIAAFFTYWLLKEEPVKVYLSPDSMYSLTLLKRNIDSGPVMPGQGGDVSCITELRDLCDKRLIFRGRLSMIQEVEGVRWDSDKVMINRMKGISFRGSQIGEW